MTIYTCFLILQQKVTQEVENFKKLSTKYKDSWEEIHGKIVSTIISTCYDQMTIEIVQRIFSNMQTSGPNIDLLNFVKLDLDYKEIARNKEMTVEDHKAAILMNIVLHY